MDYQEGRMEDLEGRKHKDKEEETNDSIIDGFLILRR